jgi:hypothetical protein
LHPERRKVAGADRERGMEWRAEGTRWVGQWCWWRKESGREDDVWVPHFGSWDSVKIWRMMDAGEENIKEIISLSWQEYSVLKQNMEYNKCGW